MVRESDVPALLQRAVRRREALLARPDLDVCRLFHGEADGMPGVFLDRYALGAVLMLHEGTTRLDADPHLIALHALELLRPQGVRAVYAKRFIKDRTALAPDDVSPLADPRPIAGEPLPESLIVNEHGRRLEVRLYDGFSTGVFLDQRENRSFLARFAPGGRVLNTFAYTGAFSVACALSGAVTTTVDVSPRYLDWAKRNFALNGIDLAQHRFARMGTLEFLDYARRKALRYELIIIDPPTYSSGNARKGVPAWRVARDLPGLLERAADRLAPGGALFVSTNSDEFSTPGRLRSLLTGALGPVRWLDAPAAPEDFPGTKDRAQWVMLAP